MADELTKALLLEEVVAPSAVADALFASVTGGVPLVQALLDARVTSPEVLATYLSRSDAPFLRYVAPLPELVDRLPPGLCARLLAIPVRRDAITGTVDVAVPDTNDPHPAAEIGFHLDAPVRLVRAPVAAIDEALRRIRIQSLPPPRGSIHPGHTLPPPVFPQPPISVPPASAVPHRVRYETPPWGTPVHSAPPALVVAESDPPRSGGLGSEIPIPLTRKAMATSRGGTQRPPPIVDPGRSPLGVGIPLDPAGLRSAVEVRGPRMPAPSPTSQAPLGASHIPAPAGIPTSTSFTAYAAQPSRGHPADVGGILAALRAAASRDEVLELVLTGARMLALRVALFVVKRGGYLGWSCTPEFGDRAQLQHVLIPLESPSVFDVAVREGLYLGPIRHDATHAGLLTTMRTATRDVALVPIRLSGRTAVVVVADEIGDTMIGTRRLEEIARAAGEALTRILRTRR